MLKKTLTLVAACVAASVCLADTNTPYAAGSSVEVSTIMAPLKGTLLDGAIPGWVMILEPERTVPTGVPLSSIAFIRAAPPIVPDSVDDDSVFDEDFGSHFVFGIPRPLDERHQFQPNENMPTVAGITVLSKEAFTLGHYDRFKVPAWVAMRWNEEDLRRSEQVNFGRPSFRSDDDLPAFAQAGTSYQFSQFRHERGHMARDADLEAWGMDAVTEGVTMSNIVPQQQGQGHVVWGRLEDEHRFIVRTDPSVRTVWVVSGPVFENNEANFFVGNNVGVPHSVYKVIAWRSGDGELRARGYIIPQNATDPNLTRYLVPIRDIEQQTGLDFLWGLEDTVEATLETAQPSALWN